MDCGGGQRLVGVGVCSFVLALSYNSLIIPNELLSGGITGISILLNSVSNINSGLLNLIFNIPIMILGYLKLGRKFMILTITSVISMSVGMMIFPVEAFVDDLLLASIFGGVVGGICLAGNRCRISQEGCNRNRSWCPCVPSSACIWCGWSVLPCCP